MADAPCTFLPWDTNFFGARIGRVNGSRVDDDLMAQILDWNAQENIDCMYLLADPLDATTVRVAEANGFHLQDIRMTFAVTKPMPGREIIPEMTDTIVLIRPSQPIDLEKLHDTARHAYTLSRFYNDPHFTEERCSALYDTWLTRSITEPDYADITFVALVDELPVGYVVCHLDRTKDIGTIGLIGVAENVRGQTMGQKLMMHTLRWFWQQGMREVQVSTQGRNIAGQRLYQRCGFLTQNLMLWYHRWTMDNP